MPDVTSIVNQTIFPSTESMLESDGTMGKQAFMNLLVTQLKYQDPLNPMENTEFVAQLSQFSSLEQLMNMNTNMETNMLLTQSLQNSMMTGLIDHNIRVLGNNTILSNSEDAAISYALYDDALVSIDIMDSSGTVVRTITAGAQSAGINEYAWDGKDDQGQQLADGLYSYQINALDEAGQDVSVTTYTVGVVSGIKFANGSPTLLIGDLEVSPADIVEIG